MEIEINTLAAIVGIVLNAVLPGNDYEFGVNVDGDINRGISINPIKNAKSAEKNNE